MFTVHGRAIITGFNGFAKYFRFLRYAQKLLVVKFRFYTKSGFRNSSLTLEFRLLIGIGRSGLMSGRICLNMVS